MYSINVKRRVDRIFVESLRVIIEHSCMNTSIINGHRSFWSDNENSLVFWIDGSHSHDLSLEHLSFRPEKSFN